MIVDDITLLGLVKELTLQFRMPGEVEALLLEDDIIVFFIKRERIDERF